MDLKAIGNLRTLIAAAIVACAGAELAIGGNITMFSVVNATLLRAHCRSPSVAAGIFPGLRAARLVPMTALRKRMIFGC